jgi:DNA-binding protein HU-beta
MSKKDLIDAVAEAAELSKDKAGVAVEAVIKHIEKTMKDGQRCAFRASAPSRWPTQGAQGAQSPDGGGHDAEGRARSQVPGIQESEGHAELKQSAAVFFSLSRARHGKKRALLLRQCNGNGQ